MQSSAVGLTLHLTMAGSSKMAETMYAQLTRSLGQAKSDGADRQLCDAN